MEREGTTGYRRGFELTVALVLAVALVFGLAVIAVIVQLTPTSF